MSRRADLVIVGGGPGGSAAAIRGARAGLDVVLIDKDEFPRDKPCGDGIASWGVHALEKLGLENELKRFHPVDGVKIWVHGKPVELSWPAVPGWPQKGYVAQRTDFDQMLIDEASASGATFREQCSVIAPIMDDERVRGVRITTPGGAEEEVLGEVVIAADGALSRLAKSVGLQRHGNAPFGLAARAHVEGDLENDRWLGVYLPITLGGTKLPGYGWAFPMGDGRVNVGIGVFARPGSPRVKLVDAMQEFMDMLPWAGADPARAEELHREQEFKAWRIPLAFATWPAWKPGFLVVGDALGVADPLTAEGISAALNTGMAAADTVLDAFARGVPEDLAAYERWLENRSGGYFRLAERLLDVVTTNQMALEALLAAGHFSRGLLRTAYHSVPNLVKANAKVRDFIFRPLRRDRAEELAAALAQAR